MDLYTWLWIAWGAMFLVIEGTALKNHDPGDALSEHVWRWFRVRGESASWNVGRLLLLGGLVWLTVHLVWGV